MTLFNNKVYSAVTAGYDHGELKIIEEPGMEREVRVPPEGIEPGRESILWNREHKLVKPPKTGLFSVYLDGSFTPKRVLRERCERWLERADMALFKHPWRTCAYAEIDECVKRGKITAQEGDKSRSHLRLAGFPRDFGLWACGVIVRRVHANSLQIFAMPLVWEMVQHVPRDQIWLPYVIWKLKHSKDRIHTIDADIYNNKWFSFRRHGS